MGSEIVLATYNGAKYIREQIESIQRQTVQEWTLIVRDDGSTDQTLDIIRSMMASDKRIRLLPSKVNKGVKQNFSLLLEATRATWVFLADQDDIWHPQKIEIMLKFAKDNKNPVLIHHDLEVVDEKGTRIHRSFWKRAGLNPKATSFNRLLMQNNVTGAAMLINRPLIKKALPIPEDAMMHDSWLALAASMFGTVIPVNERLVKYRQHASNQLGAKPLQFCNYVMEGTEKVKKTPYKAPQKQAKAFQDRFSLKNRQELIDFLALPKVSYVESRLLLFKNRFFKQGWFRNLFLFIAPYRS